MLRLILGIVAGVLLSFLVIGGGEAIGSLIWPPPAGLESPDEATRQAALAKVPLPALVAVVAGWTIGTFVGGWAGSRVAQRPIPAYVVGGLILSGIGVMLVAIPHPAWMAITGPLLTAAAAFLAARMAPRTSTH